MANAESSGVAKPLHVAAKCGEIGLVASLLDQGASVDDHDGRGCTALHYAAQEGNLELVKFLMKRGANADVESFVGAKPLHLAAEYGRKEILESFFTLGMSVDDPNSKGWTPMYYAAKNDRVEVIKYLIERKAALNIQDNEGRTSLHFALQKEPRCTNTLELLVKSGINLEIQDSDGETALHYAAERGYTDTVKQLIQLGANPDVQDSRGMTALHYAVYRRHPDTAKQLIQLGANLDVQNMHGKTALHYAISWGRVFPDTVQQLMQLGANIHVQDMKGKTALHYAIEMGCTDLAERLIQLRANLDVQDSEGKTALHYYFHRVKFNPGKCVDMKLLSSILKNQTDVVNLKDFNYNSPLSSLMEERYWGMVKVRVIELLIEAGAYLESSDSHRIMKNRDLKENITKNVNLCAQTVVNKFNNKDLPAMYAMYVPGTLPPIQNLKIRNNSGVMRNIEDTIERKIKEEGCYNLLEKSPVVLTLLCVEARISGEPSSVKMAEDSSLQKGSSNLGFMDQTQASVSNLRRPAEPTDSSREGPPPNKMMHSE